MTLKDILISGKITISGGGGGGTSALDAFLDGTAADIVTNAAFIRKSVFSGYTPLTSISAPACTQIESESTFYKCTGLTSVSFPALTTITGGNSCFNQCASLTGVVFPALTTFNGNYHFNKCTSLTYADLYSPATLGGGSTFEGCTNLTTLILRKSDSIVTLGSADCFKNTPYWTGGSGGTIYVPSALISTYRAADKWSSVDAYGLITWEAIEGSQYETHYADGTPIA